MNEIRSIAVYCGSNPGKHPDYADAARNLALLMAKEKITLVYGGAQVGLMGLIADEVLKHGGNAVGVLPKALEEKGVAHNSLDELHLVDDMHERKAKMASLADAFIALPGGIGTLEEIIEVWTWGKMGFHHKPCGFLNVRGYYDQFKGFVDHMVAEGFLWDKHNDSIIRYEESPEKLIEFFKSFTPPESVWANMSDIEKAKIKQG